jgi:hypothetical protein
MFVGYSIYRITIARITAALLPYAGNYEGKQNVYLCSITIIMKFLFDWPIEILAIFFA